MTDPLAALISFQDSFKAGTLKATVCSRNKSLHAHHDEPNGKLRVTHALIRDGEVLGIVMYSIVEKDSPPCLQVGYAVSENWRNRGIGLSLVRDSLDEMTHELRRVGLVDFYVEAVVGTENPHSNKIATKIISGTPKGIIDSPSEDPAYYYRKRINGEKTDSCPSGH